MRETRVCILMYRSPYRVAGIFSKKKAVGGRERPPRGRREMFFGHRLGCPVVHICNLNFSTSLLGIPVSASELFISAFISHILHCGPTVDLDPQSRADLSNLFHSNNSHTINHPGRVEQPTALSSALQMPHLRAWPFGLLFCRPVGGPASSHLGHAPLRGLRCPESMRRTPFFELPKLWFSLRQFRSNSATAAARNVAGENAVVPALKRFVQPSVNQHA